MTHVFTYDAKRNELDASQEQDGCHQCGETLNRLTYKDGFEDNIDEVEEGKEGDDKTQHRSKS